jgi:hypothetical protein
MSGIISKLLGISNAIIQLGKGGPNLQNNSGAIEARNPANSGFAITRGLPAVGSNDHTTLPQIPTVTFATNPTDISGAEGVTDILSTSVTIPAGKTLVITVTCPFFAMEDDTPTPAEYPVNGQLYLNGAFSYNVFGIVTGDGGEESLSYTTSFTRVYTGLSGTVTIDLKAQLINSPSWAVAANTCQIVMMLF